MMTARKSLKLPPKVRFDVWQHGQVGWGRFLVKNSESHLNWEKISRTIQYICAQDSRTFPKFSISPRRPSSTPLRHCGTITTKISRTPARELCSEFSRFVIWITTVFCQMKSLPGSSRDVSTWTWSPAPWTAWKLSSSRTVRKESRRMVWPARDFSLLTVCSYSEAGTRLPGLYSESEYWVLPALYILSRTGPEI